MGQPRPLFRLFSVFSNKQVFVCLPPKVTLWPTRAPLTVNLQKNHTDYLRQAQLAEWSLPSQVDPVSNPVISHSCRTFYQRLPLNELLKRSSM